MKKLFIVITLFLFILSGCSNENNDKELISDNKVGEKEISGEVNDDEVTIAIWHQDHHILQIQFPMIVYETNKIKKETGVDIKYDIINAKDKQEFFKKLNTKLYLDKGPTLIYFYNTPISIYTESGVALKLEEKIENLDRVYDSIKDKNDYFVPIGMETEFIEINGYGASDLGIEEPDLSWSWKDYINIRDKWIKENKGKLKSYLISETYYHRFNQLDIIDTENKRTNINTEEVKNTIKDLRSEFLEGKYNISNDLKQEDYYKVCFGNTTKEERSGKYFSFVNRPQEYIYPYPWGNGLYVSVLNDLVRKNKIVMPNIKDKDENLKLAGFLINKNGKNIDKAIKFINYILSDEIQKYLYDTHKKVEARFYPVNKELENKITKFEKSQELSEKVLQLKEYQLERIKTGKNKPNRVYKNENMSIFTLKNKLYKDIFKLIFADEEYSDSKLEGKLQELENQYNIYLNE
ncbi:extracellular solute-binding protein [Dethiothermospora halolimnae]|uniref:extracellular solute-binding protein n=1 Tax=Dethiothermospora halolimnae TaxID=3114390 RepID=UPI003CCC0690